MITKASSGRAKLEFLFTKIGVGWKLIWPRDRIDLSKERALHPPPPPSPPEKIDRINMTPPPPPPPHGIDFNWKGIDLRGGGGPPCVYFSGNDLWASCHGLYSYIAFAAIIFGSRQTASFADKSPLSCPGALALVISFDLLIGPCSYP